MRMQTLNCVVAIGGSRDHQVPKYGVTVAEAAVLRLVHGDDAVFDVEPAGTIDVSDAEELERLFLIYQRPDGVKSPVAVLFPGMGARVSRSIAELRLDPSLLKAASRVSIAVPSEPDLPDGEPLPEPTDDFDDEGGEGGGVTAAQPAPEPEPVKKAGAPRGRKKAAAPQPTGLDALD